MYMYLAHVQAYKKCTHRMHSMYKSCMYSVVHTCILCTYTHVSKVPKKITSKYYAHNHRYMYMYIVYMHVSVFAHTHSHKCWMM